MKYKTEAIRRRALANTGKKRTLEQRRRIAEAVKASYNPERRAYLRKLFKGRVFSAQTREKMSLAKMGCIPWNKGKSKSTEEGLRRLSETRRGSGNPSWTGTNNKTFRQKLHGLSEYKSWRKAVFERDNWTCGDCGIRGYKLNVHHKKPFKNIVSENKITNIDQAINCKELWNINNGVTLCVDCHKRY